MSNQYPGGYGSPMSGHRGHFSPQHPQQQLVNAINQGNAPVNIPIGSGYGQSGILSQQQPHSPIQPGMRVGAVIHSPSHMQQQQQLLHQQQQHLQMQQQHQYQQQHMGLMSASGGQSSSHLMSLNQQHMQQQVNQSSNLQHQAASLPLSQQQQQQSNAVHSGNVLGIPQPNPHKEINIVALSRLGQETVQDITSRFQEIFGALKIIQPTANRDNSTEKKVQEYFRTIRLLFKRLRIIYEKCNDGYPQGIEYTQVESLIPFKDESEHRGETVQCEEFRKAVQENQELIETVKLKNRQLREIIDRTRIIIWEINTMLNMRRS